VRSWVIDRAKNLSSTGEIDGTTNFVASGIIDSMSFVKLLMDTESEFGLELDFSELDPSEFLTIDGFANCVMQCRNNG
jgi:acyl carrier protein